MSGYTRNVLSLQIDTLVRSKLICCGFSTVEDFKDHMKVEKLKDAANISKSEATAVLQVVKPYLNATPLKPMPACGCSEAQMGSRIVIQSASQMLKQNLKSARHIVSFSKEVDCLLGGGFPLGRITEIAGEAGLGKTQFCYQLSVDVQIPECLGGVGGEAVYFDVEGTFFPQRVEQIARAAVDHCHNIANFSGSRECVKAMSSFTLEKVMSSIYLFRCRNSVQLLSATHMMVEFLASHKNVKLLVIDSVAQCVRGDEDMRARTRFLVTLDRMFRDLVVQFGVAIVLANQVTTRINDFGASYNIPALGASWSHIASVKLMLYKDGESRYVHQYKSPECSNGSARYTVTAEGIRDAELKTQQATEGDTQRSSSCFRAEENSSVPFYPITQGFANELMGEWEEDSNKQQTEAASQYSTQIHVEEIPDKWLELSQMQLNCRAMNETQLELHCEDGTRSGTNSDASLQSRNRRRQISNETVLKNNIQNPDNRVVKITTSPPQINTCPKSPILQLAKRLSQDHTTSEDIINHPPQEKPDEGAPRSPVLQSSKQLSQGWLSVDLKEDDQEMTSFKETARSPILGSTKRLSQDMVSERESSIDQVGARPVSPVLSPVTRPSPGRTTETMGRSGSKSPVLGPVLLCFPQDNTIRPYVAVPEARPKSPVLQASSPRNIAQKKNTKKFQFSTHSNGRRRILNTQSHTDMENSFQSLTEVGENPCRTRERHRVRASAALRATVETMLFSDSPARAPPKKKRCRISDENVPAPGREMVSVEMLEDGPSKENTLPSAGVSDRDRCEMLHSDAFNPRDETPPSPVLANRAKRLPK